MKKSLLLIICATLLISYGQAQNQGLMKYGLKGGLGYAFGNNQGIGLGAGFELDYNITKDVPVGLFGRVDMYHGQLIGTAGLSLSLVTELAADRYLEFKGHIGGSILPDKTAPMLGINLGFGVYYLKLFSDNAYFYIGPAINGIMDGLDVLNNMQIVMLDGGLGFYLF